MLAKLGISPWNTLRITEVAQLSPFSQSAGPGGFHMGMPTQVASFANILAFSTVSTGSIDTASDLI